MGLFDVVPQFGDLEQTNCAKCGVLFASPVVATRRKDGEGFFCPNGHPLVFNNSDLKKLQAEKERLQKSLDWEKSQRQTVERALRYQKGLATKAKNKLKRTHAGVCPECNRTFKQLAAHMHTQHPEVAL